MTTKTYSDTTLRLWDLQNDMVAKQALVECGTRVSPARTILRAQQAEEARREYADALAAATPDQIAEFADFLRAHHIATA